MLARGQVIPAAALAFCVIAAMGSSWPAGAAGAASGPATLRYADPAGWSITYPRQSMHLEQSSADAGPFAAYSEVTIANFGQQTAVHVTRSGSGAKIVVDPPLQRDGSFPADGVAFRMFLHQGVQPPPYAQVPDSRFPIPLSEFKPGRSADFPGAGGRGHGVPAWQDLQIDADGEHYTGIVLVGPRATARQRAELAGVIASLQFTAFHTGTVTSGLAALGPAGRFRVGTTTLVHAPAGHCAAGAPTCRGAGTPFYLVHAPGVSQPDLIEPCPQAGTCTPPGAFYAIGWTTPPQKGGYLDRCTLAFDPRRDEFRCTNLHASWDRVGRVLTVPAGARSGVPLQFVLAKVAWDDLVVMNVYEQSGPPDDSAVHSLLPGWPSR